MATFARDYLFVVAMLAGLGLAGGFVLLPFRRALRFGLLVAPLAGILCVTLGVATFYTMGGWSLSRSIAVSWCACSLSTCVGLAVCRPRFRLAEVLSMLIAAAIITAIAVRTNDAASIRYNTTALLYCDATDQLGYAQAADWLMAHPVKLEPEASPQSPCNAWLALLFRQDPRFGVYFFMATVAKLRGTSGAFSYDIACALSLAAGILGVAGLFARSRLSLVILLVGLLFSQWYANGRIGYVGKLNGYPAAILIAGLFLLLRRRPSIESIVVLALLAAATAIMHSGMGTVMFVAPIAVLYLLARLLATAPQFPPPVRRGRVRERVHPSDGPQTPAPTRPRHTGGGRDNPWSSAFQLAWRQSLVLGLVIGTALVATGLLARPFYIYAPNFQVKWNYIVPRSLDLEHAGANIHNWPDDGRPPLIYGHQEKLLSGVSARTLQQMTLLAGIVWVALAALAIAARDPRAIGLLLGPMILLLCLRLADRGPEAFQMMGYTYPTMLCGAAQLIDNWRSRRRRQFNAWPVTVTSLAVICIALRAPCYVGSVRRYAGSSMPMHQVFTLRQTDRLVNAMGSAPVEVDIPSLTHLLFVVIEIGHRSGVNLQWSRESYYAAFAYTHWPTPTYPPTRQRLVLASDPVPPGWQVTFRGFPYFLITRRQSPQ